VQICFNLPDSDVEGARATQRPRRQREKISSSGPLRVYCTLRAGYDATSESGLIETYTMRRPRSDNLPISATRWQTGAPATLESRRRPLLKSR
jgi:hypothetical protein